MSWTDERVELLKKLWIEGLSASQIAGELGGGVTRNAVIGKVHRLKLSGRAKPVSAAPRAHAPARPQTQRRAPSSSSVGNSGAAASPAMANIVKRSVLRTQSAGATALQAEFEPEVEVYSATIHELVIPKSERIGLLGLSERVCKWPIGDPLHAEFHFCGRPSDENRPYCQFHANKAYHQVEKRKR